MPTINHPVMYKTSDVRGDVIVSAAVQTAIGQALELWKPAPFDGPFPVKGFGIAKLKADDLIKNGNSAGGHIYTSFWGFSLTTASTWETMIDVTLSDSCYIVLTGIFCLDANPDVEMIKIVADGVEYPVMDITEMYSWDQASANFAHPVVVSPEKNLKIKWKGPTARQSKIGFLGYCVATRSYLIGEV
jgi:hypothetical protein